MKKFAKLLFAISAVVLLAASCNAPQSKNSQPQAERSAIRVFQSVEGSNLNTSDSIQVSGSETALQLLKSGHQVQTKDFGKDLGEFVESIDGIKPGKDRFWAFYINGRSSSVGASSYAPKAGDRLEWKLEKILY